jgi:predicted DNA-binding transcriptional regulator
MVRFELNIDVSHETAVQFDLSSAQALMIFYCVVRSREGLPAPTREDFLYSTGLSESTVQRHLPLLNRRGLLRRTVVQGL